MSKEKIVNGNEQKEKTENISTDEQHQLGKIKNEADNNAGVKAANQIETKDNLDSSTVNEAGSNKKENKKTKVYVVKLSLQNGAIRWEKRNVVLTKKNPIAIVKSDDIVLYEIINAGVRGMVDNDILINDKPVTFYLNKLLNKNIPDEFHVKLNDHSLYFRVGDVVLSRIGGNKIDHVFKKTDPNLMTIIKGLLLKEIVIVKPKEKIEEPKEVEDIKDVINVENAKVEICGIINDMFISRELSSSVIERIFNNYSDIIDLKEFLPTVILAEFERAKELTKENDIPIIEKLYNETMKEFDKIINKISK